MAWFGGILLFVVLPFPAHAAGGFDTWDAYLMGMLLVVSLFGLPSAGIGFFLQAFFRLRNAIFFLGAAALAFLTLLVAAYGLEKTLSVMPLLAIMLLLLFSPFFGLGWYLGAQDAQRRATRRAQHAASLPDTRN